VKDFLRVVAVPIVYLTWTARWRPGETQGIENARKTWQSLVRFFCRAALIFFGLPPTLALAENFKGYRVTTLDAVIEEWNSTTKNDGPGVSFARRKKSNSSPRCAKHPSPAATLPSRQWPLMIDLPIS
jgi:hypothetical protein